MSELIPLSGEEMDALAGIFDLLARFDMADSASASGFNAAPLISAPKGSALSSDTTNNGAETKTQTRA